MHRLVRYALIGLLVFLAQWLVLGRLRIFGVAPDAVLLFVAWLSLRFGRRYGLVAGFVLGFLMDAVTEMWGIHMLIKSLVGFLVGLFPASERETLLILPSQAFIGGLVISLFHNGLMVLILAVDTGVRSSFLLFGLWLGAALYTALVALTATLLLSR